MEERLVCNHGAVGSSPTALHHSRGAQGAAAGENRDAALGSGGFESLALHLTTMTTPMVQRHAKALNAMCDTLARFSIIGGQP